MAHSQRREHLVATAVDLFSEHGFHATGIDAILAKAGVSKKTLYRHFRSKDELLVAVLDTGVQQLAGYLAHQMAKTGDPVAAVRAWAA